MLSQAPPTNERLIWRLRQWACLQLIVRLCQSPSHRLLGPFTRTLTKSKSWWMVPGAYDRSAGSSSGSMWHVVLGCPDVTTWDSRVTTDLTTDLLICDTCPHRILPPVSGSWDIDSLECPVCVRQSFLRRKIRRIAIPGHAAEGSREGSRRLDSRRLDGY